MDFSNPDEAAKKEIENALAKFIAKKDYLQVAKTALVQFFTEKPSINDPANKATRQYFDDIAELVETFKTADEVGIVNARNTAQDDLLATYDQYLEDDK